MTKLQEKFVCQLIPGESGTVLYEGPEGPIGRLETEVDATHILVFFHSEERCREGKCGKPVGKVRYAPKTESEAPSYDPLDDKIKNFLEGIFGPGSVERVAVEELFKAKSGNKPN